MKKLIHLMEVATNWLTFLSPLVDLAVRVCVGMVFWRSGIVKMANMDSTIWLFANEYHVPLFSPTFAAYLSTGTELIFSALLMAGLLGRFSAFVLFCVNLIAMLSYPTLHDTGVQWHITWGLMLLVTLVHGPGKISLDHFIWKKLHK